MRKRPPVDRRHQLMYIGGTARSQRDNRIARCYPIELQNHFSVRLAFDETDQHSRLATGEYARKRIDQGCYSGFVVGHIQHQGSAVGQPENLKAAGPIGSAKTPATSGNRDRKKFALAKDIYQLNNNGGVAQLMGSFQRQPQSLDMKGIRPVAEFQRLLVICGAARTHPVQRSLALRAHNADNVLSGLRQYANNMGNTLFDDAGFLPRNHPQAVAEYLNMITTDIRRNRHQWMKHIGSIKTATQSGLDDGNINLLTSEIVECESRYQLKEGEFFFTNTGR